MTKRIYRPPVFTLTLSEAQVNAITGPALDALRKEHARIVKREAKKLEKALAAAKEAAADYKRVRTLSLEAQTEIRKLKHELREYR